MDNRSLEEILEDIDSVTKEEIVEAISHVVLDTIYFMKSSKNQ